MTVASAVRDRLQTWAEAQTFLVSVYYVQVPGIPPVDPTSLAGRYVVVFPIGEPWTAEGIDAVSSSLSATVQVTCVAWLTEDFQSPADEVEWLQRQVKLQLVDWAPPVGGVTTTPFRHSLAGNLRPDESITDRHIIYSVDQFSLIGVRTS